MKKYMTVLPVMLAILGCADNADMTFCGINETKTAVIAVIKNDDAYQSIVLRIDNANIGDYECESLIRRGNKLLLADNTVKFFRDGMTLVEIRRNNKFHRIYEPLSADQMSLILTELRQKYTRNSEIWPEYDYTDQFALTDKILDAMHICY